MYLPTLPAAQSSKLLECRIQLWMFLVHSYYKVGFSKCVAWVKVRNLGLREQII